MTIEHPIVVRLDGTNAEEGRQLLDGRGAAEPPRRADDARRGAARGGAGAVTDVWSERAEAYRKSQAHREGPDLDLIVEWAAGAKTALDVATGGGHVARRLREAGLNVVTTRRRAGDAAGRRRARRGPAVRRRKLRPRRLAARRAPLRRRARGGARDGARRGAAR